jgi:nicotinate-nucleotide adenylyltransferase
VVVTRRIGIIGGTFDPIHNAHLVIAQEAAWAQRLDSVIFIPAHQPPHKQREPVSAAEHRLTMTRLAVADNSRFTVSTIEMEREGPSFTVDTLRTLQAPDLELCFIVGMDSLVDLPTWHDPEGILRLAQVVAVYRGGWDRVDLAQLEARLPAARGRVVIVPIPALDISSTDIRQRVTRGQPIRYLTPDPVVTYIEGHRLYRD